MKKNICIALTMFVLLICCFSSGCSKSFIETFSTNCDNYNLQINIDEQSHLANVKQTTTYVNKTGSNLDSIYFHLYANAFKETAVNKPVSSVYQSKAYYNGFSDGGIEDLSISINNNNINPEFADEDKTLLKVLLAQSLNNKSKIDIVFNYTVKIPNVNHRFGYGENTINMANFYPIASVFENGKFDENGYHYNGDPFYSNVSNYNVSITHNKSYVLASTGYLKNTTEDQTTVTEQYEAKAVRDYALVLSNKFKTLNKTISKTTVKYYYYNDEQPEQSLNTSILSLKTFNNMFGTYPYSSLSVVESNFVHGGMEFPNLVLISDSLDKYEDYTETIVHEIAHQWWYGLVGNNEFNYGWLDEGLTEFSTAMFFDKNSEYNVEYKTFMENAESSYSLFVDVYEDVFKNVDTTMNRKLNEFKTEPEYVYISYVKGMLLFDNLKTFVGEKNMLKGLKLYFKNFKGKNACPNDLINCFEKATGKNLQSFFDSWINGKVVISKEK